VASDDNGNSGQSAIDLLDMQAYCSPTSNNLGFRLEDKNNSQNLWHASGITIDFHGTPLGYHKRMTDRLKFTEFAHHTDETMW
jgi:hypothetical protein